MIGHKFEAVKERHSIVCKIQKLSGYKTIYKILLFWKNYGLFYIRIKKYARNLYRILVGKCVMGHVIILEDWLLNRVRGCEVDSDDSQKRSVV